MAFMQIVRLKSNLSEEELLKRAREREPQFKAISGILQKYYIKLGDNEYGGVYIWDSMESIMEFRQSELAASIPQAYEVIAPPEITISEVMFQLRD